MKLDWKQIVSVVAPTIGTALGGPLAGVAVKTLASQLLGKPDATETDVEAAVVNADPQTLLKLKEIELEFSKTMTEAGVKFEEIAAGDRANAREREIKTGDHTPAILAYGITAGFFLVLGYMVVYGKPATGGDALLVMLGSLGTAWAGVCTYYYGSSAGGRRKDETIATIAKMP